MSSDLTFLTNEAGNHLRDRFGDLLGPHTQRTSDQALRQSILRHAFTGQLVPQDPNYEPAAELLQRIAAERAERGRQAASAKRSKKVVRAAPGKRSKGA